MKTTLLFPAVALSLGIFAWTAPLALADSEPTSTGTPGAQGSQNSNPTHEIQNPSGANGNHAGDTNPNDTPAPAHKKHHKKMSSSSSTNA